MGTGEETDERAGAVGVDREGGCSGRVDLKSFASGSVVDIGFVCVITMAVQRRAFRRLAGMYKKSIE